MVVEQKAQLTVKETYIRDLEDYIDNLLVRVMETQPRLLQNPYTMTPATMSVSASNIDAVTDVREAAVEVVNVVDFDVGSYARRLCVE